MHERLAPLLAALPLRIAPTMELSSTAFALLSVWIPALAFIALCLPNSLEIVRRFEPALGYAPRAAATRGPAARLQWVPTFGWAAIVSMLAATAVLQLGGKSEFLYWQF